MHGKLETDHKTHAFIFHTSHHKSPNKKKKITEFINYQTKNNTTQPNNPKKKNLGNEPREVDVGLANPGIFTLTVLRWVVTNQRGRSVGLASTAGWTWKRMEEEWLSESKAMRVGKSECLRGAMTMRWVRPWDCDSDGLREAMAMTVRIDESENESLSVLLWGWGTVKEVRRCEGGEALWGRQAATEQMKG